MKTEYNIVFKAFRESINLEFYAQLNYYSRAKVKRKTHSDLQRRRVLTNHRLTREIENSFLSTKGDSKNRVWVQENHTGNILLHQMKCKTSDYYIREFKF